MIISRRKRASAPARVLAIMGLVILATGISTPAHAWGSGTIYSSSQGGPCIGGTANKWSSTNAKTSSAGTNESGNFCPAGAPLLSAALRWASGINGGGGVGYSYVTGYKSVVTTVTGSSLLRGGVHTFGGIPGNT